MTFNVNYKSKTIKTTDWVDQNITFVCPHFVPKMAPRVGFEPTTDRLTAD